MEISPKGNGASPRRSVDFDAMYRGVSPLGKPAGGLVPWDIGGPQPVIAELEQAGEISGNVLDAGCGLGDNAVFLARRGYRVVAFDSSPTAIEKARRGAEADGAEIQFRVADAMDPSGLGHTFDTVVDSALYHCLDPEERVRYIAALHDVTGPGGVLHILCHSDLMTAAFAPHSCIGEDELRRVLANGWRISRLARTRIVTSMTPEYMERAAAALGLTGMDEHIARFGIDSSGRYLAPAWQVSAERI